MNAEYLGLNRRIRLEVCLVELDWSDKLRMLEDLIEQLAWPGMLAQPSAIVLAEKLEEAARRLREDVE